MPHGTGHSCQFDSVSDETSEQFTRSPDLSSGSPYIRSHVGAATLNARARRVLAHEGAPYITAPSWVRGATADFTGVAFVRFGRSVW